LPAQHSAVLSAAETADRAALPEAPRPHLAADPLPAGISSSQQPQTPAPAATDQDQAPLTEQQRREKAAAELKAEEQQRMLGVMPAFNAVINGHAEPLSVGQKFHLFFKGSVDPYQFVITGIDAGIEQAEDSYPEYGEGVVGFAKRYGASFADTFDGNFWGNAVLPSLLHQDPRYFRLGHGSIWHRILYSASTTVRAKSDKGKWEPNFSNIGGNFIGGAISNLYYPASDRGVALTLERGITVTGEGTFGALAIEFYPDLVHYYKRKHQEKLARESAAAAANSSTPVPPAKPGP